MSTPPPSRRPADASREPPVQDCPACGRPMVAIAGSRLAICRTCGYKEPCC